MTGAREITALRKGGRLEDAFNLATDLISRGNADEQILSAHGWCLIEFVKRHATDKQHDRLREFAARLEAFQVPRGNELLEEHRKRALALCNEKGQAVAAARKLGKEGRHEDAAQAFSTIHQQSELSGDDRVSFGWELFKANQTVFKSANGNELRPSAVTLLKRRLGAYLKLGLDGQTLLHSCILQQAVRLAEREHLRLAPFIALWDLDQYRREDYEENVVTNGKRFPSLAETVLQRASKEAANGGRADEMEYILPHLERGLQRFPENIWLKLNMVKLLRGLNRLDEARLLAIEFARSKAGEFWTWDLLGDLETDRAMRRSCYAKALSCSEDDKFTSKVRLKFAFLISDEFPGQAKAELERIIEHKCREGSRIPPDAQQLSQSDWFAAANSAPSGQPFYSRFQGQAEELLFAHLPWHNACLGDEFVIEREDGSKKRSRKIYVSGNPCPSEIKVSASNPSVKGQAAGTPILVQTESPPGEPWRTTVHRVRARPDAVPFDVLTQVCGVIVHINHSAGVFHFVVAKGVDGTFRLSEYGEQVEVGAAVAVKMARSRSQKGFRSNVVSVSPTNMTPNDDICRVFGEKVEVRNGLGFTPAGVFIPPELVASSQIDHGDYVDGVAVLNYNKKHATWGWKAARAKSCTAPLRASD